MQPLGGRLADLGQWGSVRNCLILSEVSLCVFALLLLLWCCLGVTEPVEAQDLDAPRPIPGTETVFIEK